MTEQRPSFFTPSWFGALFRGEHSLGDTFWGGAFGVQLIFVPLWAAAEFLIQITLPDLEPTIFATSMAVFLAYALVLTRGVFIVARRSQSAGGWRWSAVVYCLIFVVILGKMLLSSLAVLTS